MFVIVHDDTSSIFLEGSVSISALLMGDTRDKYDDEGYLIL